MKILFLTSKIPDPHSGASVRPYYVIKFFHLKYGYDIDLITMNSLNNKENSLRNIKEWINKIITFPIKIEDNRKNLVYYSTKNCLTHGFKTKNGIFDPSFYKKKYIQKFIDDYLKNNTIDCIYSDAGMAGYIANSEIPKIVEPLDINYKNWYKRSKENKHIKEKAYWFLRAIQTYYREIKIYNNFNYVTVVTKNDKKNIEDYLSNLVVIPNGTDIKHFKPLKRKEKTPSLVFTGVMNSIKNVEAVLYFYKKIFPIIKKHFPNIKFYIVGKSPSPQIKSLDRDSSVIVTGFVNDIRPYLAGANIYICPIISGTGIKNKVLEAMAMGKPVVSTDIGALGIDISHKENIFIADKPEEFANYIIKLLENPDLRKKIGSNGRKLIEEKYSWKSTASSLNKLFVKVVKNNEN